MHDPDTQAFVIPYGFSTQTFKNGSKWRYWKPFITIWHHDPERDGSDDSCGWSRPRLTKDQKEICKYLASEEAREPWFMKLQARKIEDPVLCEHLLFGAFMLVSMCLKNRKMLRRSVTVDEARRWASELTYNAVDNFRSSLCFLSGYHSNWYDPSVPNTTDQDLHWREEQARSFFTAIMAWILRERRFWFQHPRWHAHHWRLQFHTLQTFKRWAFSKCCHCGNGFSWGYAPTTDSWNRTGPKWFRSEKHVYHHDCSKPKDEQKPSEMPVLKT